jgi:polar amino acid transport system substrate-binding protein
MTRSKFLLALAAGFAFAVSVNARTLEEIKADGKIVVATEGAFAPFNYFQGAKLTGFEVELAEALAKKMGVKLEWKTISFDALLPGLAQNRWDMVLASFAITDERSKSVTFSNPYYCSGGVIVAKDPNIKEAKDLAGKVVAVQTGTTYMEKLKSMPGVKEVKNFPRDTDAHLALINGRADAWISDRFLVKSALESNPKLGLKLGGYLLVEKIAAAVRKDNASLASAINKAIADVMADGTYKALSEKYFKEDIRCR